MSFGLSSLSQLSLSRSPLLTQGGGTPTPSGPVLSASASGLTVQPANPATQYFPDDPDQRVTYALTRQGYDTAGTLVSYETTRTLLAPLPQAPYLHGSASDIATPDPSGAAIPDQPHYVTDSIASAALAPKPFGGAVVADRLPIFDDGDGHFYATIDIDPVALWGRFQRTAPFVPVMATHVGSGTTIDWAGATWFDKFEDMGDRYAAPGYRAAVDFASLGDGLIAVDYEIYPFVGDSRSIRSTLDPDAPRGVRTLYFYKISGTAPILYIKSDGNDSTGTGASGAPYASLGRALNALGAGGRDGATIRVMDNMGAGTVAVTAAGATNCAVTIEADPAAVGAVTLTLPDASYSTNCKYFRFRNLTVIRTGARYWRTTAGGMQIFDHCVLNMNGTTSIVWTDQLTELQFVGGGSIINNTGTSLQGVTNVNITLMRGLQCLEANSANVPIDMYHVFGCDMRGMRQVGAASRDYSGATVTGTVFSGCGGPNDTFAPPVPSLGTLKGFAMQQVSIEWTSATSGIALGISRDSPADYSTDSVCLRNVTLAGAGIAGRINGAYDSTIGVLRTHLNWDTAGSIISHAAMKGGQFLGNTGSAAEAPEHIGNLPLLLGQGYRDNVFLHPAVDGDYAHWNYAVDFTQIYAGLNSFAGSTLPTRTDVFADYKGVTTVDGSTYVAGAGGSDLRVKDSGSPAYGRVAAPVFALKLDGSAAPTPDNAGAWGAA